MAEVLFGFLERKGNVILVLPVCNITPNDRIVFHDRFESFLTTLFVQEILFVEEKIGDAVSQRIGRNGKIGRAGVLHDKDPVVALLRKFQVFVVLVAVDPDQVRNDSGLVLEAFVSHADLFDLDALGEKVGDQQMFVGPGTLHHEEAVEIFARDDPRGGNSEVDGSLPEHGEFANDPVIVVALMYGLDEACTNLFLFDHFLEAGLEFDGFFLHHFVHGNKFRVHFSSLSGRISFSRCSIVTIADLESQSTPKTHYFAEKHAPKISPISHIYINVYG